MGVPAFFRWLSRKYPSVIVECIEQKPIVVDGVCVPVNSGDPNPNGVEFDNLYLDMNGIIHPCTHPEDKPAPKDEDEMMEAIFECIDRLFRIVRPRKLLYMAIDGVAPRAKMNQQRSRRFRASKETYEKINEIDRIRSELAGKGVFLPPEKPKEEHFDSNCITPGTPFMARLSSCLHYYIHERLNNDPGWRNIKVILSDANVPGEGEHKIMDFIRRQRAQPDHDPNTQHVLCGADADLIMLGLATHEPNFTIIREEFKPNKPKPCDICGQLGHEMRECTGAEPNQKPEENTYGSECQYIFVRLNVLREYLERELYMPNLPFKYDFERAVDDWVFMCFFVGNDFLPHLPSLEIREGAIDRLVNLYKKAVYKTGGFLTDSGDVNLDRVQVIMSDLGDAEDEIFKRRQQNELAFKQREKDKKRRNEIISNFKPKWIPTGQFAPTAPGQTVKPVENARYEAYQMRMQGRNYNTSAENANTNHALESMLSPENAGNRGQKRKIEEVEEDSDDDQAHDEVRLWEDGFKDRYYESKFDVSPDNLAFRNNVALQYVRGLCWVLRYYYQGCASWRWYFPYHYAPFASDFINIGGLSTEFEKGTEPFRPLEQLMGVFPAASSKHVPAPWAKLMTDPQSMIIDFYPEDFKIDLNGKKFAWQGVALLPFVDENRLFKALAPYYDSLTEAEKKRNVRGDDRLYVGVGNNGYTFVKGLYINRVGFDKEIEISIDGMRGTVSLSEDCVNEGGTLVSPVRGLPVRSNKVYCIKFKDPKYSGNHIFLARKLKGAKEPPRVLKPQDFDAMNRNNDNQWKPQIGFTRSTQSASLGQAGHRMLDHHTNRIRPPMYANVPPPMGLYQSYGMSKKKWKKLLKKKSFKKCMETKSSETTEKLKNWKFPDAVETFLVPKEAVTSVTTNNEVAIDIDQYINEYYGSDIDDEMSNGCYTKEEDEDYDIPLQIKERDISSSQSFAQSTPQVSKKSTNVRENYRNRQDSTTRVDTTTRVVNNKNTDTQQVTTSTNEIDLFFNSIAATVKKLSSYNQLVAKATVFSTVSQLEMAEMSGTFQFSSFTPSSSQSSHNTLIPTPIPSPSPVLQNVHTSVPLPSVRQSLRRSTRRPVTSQCYEHIRFNFQR